MEQITSSDNSKIKLAASLHLRKNRERSGLFVAEGLRLCEMAAESEWVAEFALVTEKALNEPRVNAVIKKLEEKGCPVYETTEIVYKKAAATMTPQGIMTVMKQQRPLLEETIKNADILVVLDGVQDAGNAGSIIRTADSVGCSAVIILQGSVDAFSDKTIRSTMGSVFHLPIVENVDADELISLCEDEEIKLFATALDKDAKTCFETEYGRKKALVFGNEGNGISDKLLKKAEHIYIPMCGRAESLNVAAAAAVVLYDVFRKK